MISFYSEIHGYHLPSHLPLFKNRRQVQNEHSKEHMLTNICLSKNITAVSIYSNCTYEDSMDTRWRSCLRCSAERELGSSMEQTRGHTRSNKMQMALVCVTGSERKVKDHAPVTVSGLPLAVWVKGSCLFRTDGCTYVDGWTNVHTYEKQEELNEKLTEMERKWGHIFVTLISLWRNQNKTRLDVEHVGLINMRNTCGVRLKATIMDIRVLWLQLPFVDL